MENFGVECTQSSGKLRKYPHFISKRVFFGVRVCRQQHHLDDCNMMGDGCVVSMSIAINSLLAGRDNVLPCRIKLHGKMLETYWDSIIVFEMGFDAPRTAVFGK